MRKALQSNADRTVTQFLAGGSLLFFVFLTLCQGCTGKNEATDGNATQNVGPKTQEQSAIEKNLMDLAKANTEFPKTKDRQSVLRFYSQDYSGIADGQLETLQGISKNLSDLTDRINLGEPVGISAKASNITAHVTDSSAWATYDYEYKVGTGGMVLDSNQGKCTSIFRNQAGSWQIQHEHCSRPRSPIFLK